MGSTGTKHSSRRPSRSSRDQKRHPERYSGRAAIHYWRRCDRLTRRNQNSELRRVLSILGNTRHPRTDTAGRHNQTRQTNDYPTPTRHKTPNATGRCSTTTNHPHSTTSKPRQNARKHFQIPSLFSPSPPREVKIDRFIPHVRKMQDFVNSSADLFS